MRTITIGEIEEIVRANPGVSSWDIAHMIDGEQTTQDRASKISAKCYRLKKQGYLMCEHTRAVGRRGGPYRLTRWFAND